VTRPDRAPAVAQGPEAFGRAALRGVVVAEQGEAMVVKAPGEVSDIAAEDQFADLNRLVTRSVARSEEQEDRAIAEQVVVTIEELDRPVRAGVVAGQVEVPAHGRVVMPGRPLGALDDQRDGLGNQRQGPGVVPVQMGEDESGDRGQIDLLGDAPVLLRSEGTNASGRP
jgi:hypothetical protein